MISVQVLVGVVRTHPTTLQGRLVKFVEICLNARADVTASTSRAAIALLVRTCSTAFRWLWRLVSNKPVFSSVVWASVLYQYGKEGC